MHIKEAEKLNLFHLYRAGGDYDIPGEMHSCVVCAKDELQARIYASRSAADEGAEEWLSEAWAMRIGTAIDDLLTGIVCLNFHAGQ